MKFTSLLNQLKIDESEFDFQFQSHPNYPSALAFSDTLRFMGISNEAYELEKEFWNEIDQDFVTVFENQISLVRKDGLWYNVYSEKTQTVDFENLKKSTSDLVILLDTATNSIAMPKNKHRFWLTLFLVILIAAYICKWQWNFIMFNIFSLLGAYLSIEIFKEKSGNTSPVLSNICGKPTEHVSSSSCNKIIMGDRLNLFGFKLADISLVYFCSMAILGLLLPNVQGIMFWISLLATTSILYSAYVQIFIEKVACRICMLIITLLLAQAGISVFTFHNNFEIGNIIYPALIFTGILLAVKYIAEILSEKQIYKKESSKGYQFRRNFELFELLLERNPKIEFKNKYSSFFFGSKGARLHISIISNPFCGFCAEAHAIVENLLEKYPEQISAQIRFNYNENANSELKKVISAFKFSYITEGQKTTLAKIKQWFKEKNIDKLPVYNIDLNDEVLVGNENFSYGFSFTPVILINGRQFPDVYDRKDIIYFIDDLLDK